MRCGRYDVGLDFERIVLCDYFLTAQRSFLWQLLRLQVSLLAKGRPRLLMIFPPFPAAPGSRPTSTLGQFSSPNMTVDVVLAPNNESELSDLLANLYDPKSQSYRHWLGTGRVQLAFCPEQRADCRNHQLSAGKWIGQWNNLRPRSCCARADPAARWRRRSGLPSALTAIRRGVTYFSNASAVQLPTSLASGVRRCCRSFEYRAHASARGVR